MSLSLKNRRRMPLFVGLVWCLLAGDSTCAAAAPFFDPRFSRSPFLGGNWIQLTRGGSSSDTVEAPPDVTKEESILNETSSAINNSVNVTQEGLTVEEDEEYPKRYYFPLCKPGDGSETDPDGLPGRFLRMQKGHREKAKHAFQHTLEWRAAHDVDTVLERPHAKFRACKAVLPHYFCGRDTAGHVVFVQRPGQINMELAKANHVSTQDLLQHYVYVLEYCWNILEPRPDQTMTSVIDLKGVNFGAIMEMISFVKQFVGMMSAHYPQRSYKTLLVNAPRWFNAIYKLLAPLLRESTKAKIEIHRHGKKQDAALRKYLGDLAPAELLSDVDESKGSEGTGADSPIERELLAFCTARLEEAGLELQVLA